MTLTLPRILQTAKTCLQQWNVNRLLAGYSQTHYAPGTDGHSYRTDCSGYISMLFGLTGSPNTAALATDQYSKLIDRDDLRFGDIVIVPGRDGHSGHVRLFDHWIDADTYAGHDFGHGVAPLHTDFPYPGRFSDGRDYQPRRLNIVRDAGGNAPSKPTTPPPSKPKPTGDVPTFPGTVRPGDRGRTVSTVQQRLIDRGWKSLAAAGAPNGVFGPATESVVRAFQQQKGLKVDGVVGPVTWDALWILPTT